MLRKPARLRVEVDSKLPGPQPVTRRRVGTRCLAERNRSNPGQWIIWFGREFALIDAVKLHDTVEFTS